MGKFILYTLLFLFPFVILTILLEKGMRNIPNDYMVKNELWEQKIDSTEILVLGSSHAALNIDPQYFSRHGFNAAHISQSSDINYYLLNKHSENLHSVKYLIIPVFSLYGGSLTDGVERWRASYYNIYYDIPIEKNPLKTLLVLNGQMKLNLIRLKNYYIDKQIENVHVDKNGFQANAPATDIELIKQDAVIATKRHTAKNDKYYDKNIAWLNKTISIAKEHDIKIIFFRTPCHKSYRDLSDKVQMDNSHSKMKELKDNKDVFYYDLFDCDSELTLEDYSDSNHLSYLGAKKLTLTLDSIILNIECH